MTATFQFKFVWIGSNYKSVRACAPSGEVSTGSDSDRVLPPRGEWRRLLRPVAIAPGTDLIAAFVVTSARHSSPKYFRRDVFIMRRSNIGLIQLLFTLLLT